MWIKYLSTEGIRYVVTKTDEQAQHALDQFDTHKYKVLAVKRLYAIETTVLELPHDETA